MVDTPQQHAPPQRCPTLYRVSTTIATDCAALVRAGGIFLEQPTKDMILQHLDLAARPRWMCHVEWQARESGQSPSPFPFFTTRIFAHDTSVAFPILSSLRTSGVPSSSRPRISRHLFATSPHPGTTNASRTSDPPQKSPSASSMTPARPSKPSQASKQLYTRRENGMRVSVRPTSPPALRRPHLAAAAARGNGRAGRGTSLP